MTKFEASAKITDQMDALHDKIANLAWKYSEPGCQTEERKGRLDAMSAQYKALFAQRAAIWAA
jgi:hypothetical protein